MFWSAFIPNESLFSCSWNFIRNIWINLEQTQILIQVRSHVYMWILHIEEDCSLCNMFYAWNWMQLHVIKCMWKKYINWYYKHHFNEKERCFDFSNLLSSDFVRSMSHDLIVQVTLFLAVVTVLRYYDFSVLIFLLCSRFSKFNKSGEADIFRLELKYFKISGSHLIHLEQYCEKLPHLC